MKDVEAVFRMVVMQPLEQGNGRVRLSILRKKGGIGACIIRHVPDLGRKLIEEPPVARAAWGFSSMGFGEPEEDFTRPIAGDNVADQINDSGGIVRAAGILRGGETGFLRNIIGHRLLRG
jgi:hypothetical protein